MRDCMANNYKEINLNRNYNELSKRFVLEYISNHGHMFDTEILESIPLSSVFGRVNCFVSQIKYVKNDIKLNGITDYLDCIDLLKECVDLLYRLLDVKNLNQLKSIFVKYYSPIMFNNRRIKILKEIFK